MLTMSIISTIVIATVIAVIVIVKKGNKKETVIVIDNRYESLEAKATKEANKMTAAEIADMLRRHSIDSWECKVSEGVMTRISALSISSITVHGTTFTSVKRAINKSVALSDADALRLLTLDKEMLIIRKKKFAASTNYTIGHSTLVGKVYAYKPSKIAIESKAGKPCRIIIKINKLADNKVEVTDIYVAEHDIRSAKSYDHYDMTNDEIIKRFEKLVLGNEAEYGDEIEELERVLERVYKYNYLIENKLLKIVGGTFIFSIPTDDQLKEIKDMDIDMPNTVDEVDDESEDLSEELFENVYSSQE